MSAEFCASASSSGGAAAVFSSSEIHSAPPPLLLISEELVSSSITMPQAIHINAQAFLAAYSSAAHIPPYGAIVEPTRSNPQVKNANLFKPAMLEEALGLKVVCPRPENERLGLPTCPAVVLLTDRQSGFPVALVQATYLTAFRTAAGSGAATDALARSDASVLSVFGAGLQAEQHIKAMIAVRPITEVHIINRSRPRAAHLAKQLLEVYPAVQFHVHESASTNQSHIDAQKAAVAASHIICTTTNSLTPLLQLSDVSPGTHINAIGSYLPNMHELSTELVAACRICVDSTTDALHAGDLHTPLEQGAIRKEDMVHVAACLSWKKYQNKMENGVGFQLKVPENAGEPVRTNDSTRTLFKSVGTAIQDITTAYAVLQVCQQTGKGKTAQW